MIVFVIGTFLFIVVAFAILLVAYVITRINEENENQNVEAIEMAGFANSPLLNDINDEYNNRLTPSPPGTSNTSGGGTSISGSSSSTSSSSSGSTTKASSSGGGVISNVTSSSGQSSRSSSRSSSQNHPRIGGTGVVNQQVDGNVNESSIGEPKPIKPNYHQIAINTRQDHEHQNDKQDEQDEAIILSHDGGTKISTSSSQQNDRPSSKWLRSNDIHHNHNQKRNRNRNRNHNRNHHHNQHHNHRKDLSDLADNSSRKRTDGGHRYLSKYLGERFFSRLMGTGSRANKSPSVSGSSSGCRQAKSSLRRSANLEHSSSGQRRKRRHHKTATRNNLDQEEYRGVSKIEAQSASTGSSSDPDLTDDASQESLSRSADSNLRKMSQESTSSSAAKLNKNKNNININNSDKKRQTTPISGSGQQLNKQIVDDLDTRDMHLGGCPLHWCKTRRSLDKLIKMGIPIDSANTRSEYPIHVAVRRHRLQVLIGLLCYGADVNCVNESGETPLMMACKLNNLVMVQLLLVFDANPDHRDNWNRSARHYVASSCQRHENQPSASHLILAMLHEMGGKRCSKEQAQMLNLGHSSSSGSIDNLSSSAAGSAARTAGARDGSRSSSDEGGVINRQHETLMADRTMKSCVGQSHNNNNNNNNDSRANNNNNSMTTATAKTKTVTTTKAAKTTKTSNNQTNKKTNDLKKKLITSCTPGCSPEGYYNGQSYNKWPCYENESYYNKYMFDEILEQLEMSIDNSKNSFNSDSKQKQVLPKKSRLLNIDGGGMRGVIVAQVMIEIEKHLPQPFISYFDWIGGTSVGSFMVVALAKGIPLLDLRRICFDTKDEIFTGTRPYSASYLERVLKRTLGAQTRMSDIKGANVAVTTVLADRDPCQLRLFRNYKSSTMLLNEHGFGSPYYKVSSHLFPHSRHEPPDHSISSNTTTTATTTTKTIISGSQFTNRRISPNLERNKNLLPFPKPPCCKEKDDLTRSSSNYQGTTNGRQSLSPRPSTQCQACNSPVPAPPGPVLPLELAHPTLTSGGTDSEEPLRSTRSILEDLAATSSSTTTTTTTTISTTQGGRGSETGATRFESNSIISSNSDLSLDADHQPLTPSDGNTSKILTQENNTLLANSVLSPAITTGAQQEQTNNLNESARQNISSSICANINTNTNNPIASNSNQNNPQQGANSESQQQQQQSAVIIQEDENDPLVWQVVRASGAAPFYFRPYGPYLDGGLISNNPTLDMMSEFFSHKQAHEFLEKNLPPSINNQTVVTNNNNNNNQGKRKTQQSTDNVGTINNELAESLSQTPPPESSNQTGILTKEATAGGKRFPYFRSLMTSLTSLHSPSSPSSQSPVAPESGPVRITNHERLQDGKDCDRTSSERNNLNQNQDREGQKPNDYNKQSWKPQQTIKEKKATAKRQQVTNYHRRCCNHRGLEMLRNRLNKNVGHNDSSEISKTLDQSKLTDSRLEEAESLEQQQLGLVVSLGTGRARVLTRNNGPMDFGNLAAAGLATVFSPVELLRSLRAAREMFRILLSQACQTEDHIVDRAQAWCCALNVAYFRINPPLTTILPIDDKRDEQIINALWQTKIYMRTMNSQTAKLARILQEI